MIKRLRTKFVCINMAIVTVMLVVIFGMVLHFTYEDLQNQSLRAMAMAVEERRPLGKPGEAAEHMLKPWFVAQIEPDGTAAVVGSTFFDLSDEALVQELIREALNSQEKNGILKEHRLRFQKFTSPLGQRILFMDISSELETIMGLVRTCCLIGAVSFLAFLGLSLLLARWAIRPVERAWEQQKQFVADASHELKTPLTVIMTNAELLQDPGYDEEARKTFVSGIAAMSVQMRGLVEGLLELARVDNGTRKMNFERLDYSALIAESLLLFEPVYFEQGLSLESQVEEGLWLKGSPSHLQQVTEILLDNGIKYSAPQGTVRVILRRQGNHCLLSVESPGESISKEDLQNIFRRFYRIDKAREMNGSYGLGLSIANGIISDHGGRIWAQSSGGINTFTVQLSLDA